MRTRITKLDYFAMLIDTTYFPPIEKFLARDLYHNYYKGFNPFPNDIFWTLPN